MTSKPLVFRQIPAKTSLFHTISKALFLISSVFFFQPFAGALSWGDTIADSAVLGKIATQELIDRLAKAPDSGTAYGINTFWKTLYFFNLPNYQVRSKITLPKKPTDLAVDPRTNVAYVTGKGPLWPTQSGALYVLNPEGQIVNSLTLPPNPQGIAVNPENRTIVITLEGDRKLRLISTETLATVREIPLPYWPKRIALDLDSNRAVVTAREHWWSILPNLLLIVDLTNGAILQEFRFEGGIGGIAVDSDKDLAVAVSPVAIHLIDIDQGTLLATIQSTISLLPPSGNFNDGEVDFYYRVDLNPSTHTAVVAGEGGVLLINLNDRTATPYQTGQVQGMKAIAVDRFRNTALASYWKPVSLFLFEKGLLEIQLPNPVPEIAALTPNQAPRGSAAQTVVVSGAEFITSSGVSWNKQPLPADFIDNQRLQISLSTQGLAAAGLFPIAVTNPGPQGGLSNAILFTVTNPLPTITALYPASAPAGTQGRTVTLHGKGLLKETTVSLGGRTRPIDFINDTEIQIALAPTDLENAGTLEIIASNPTPGGGVSNSMSFTVTNSLPVLSSLSPDSVKAGGPEFTLTLTGTGFAGSATVRFNNDTIPATRVSDTRIEAAITAAVLRTEGSYPVQVTNPAPGGGSSATLNLLVTRASAVAPLPEGAYGKQYEDLFPADAAIPSYDPKRFALITGQVKDKTGNPLAGVTVGIHSRPEFGSAQTDGAGRFSLPLDGGGTVTLTFQKPGFLTAHRQVSAPLNGIVTSETLVLLAEDAAATALIFDGNASRILLHQSSTISDASGSRSLTMILTGDNRAFVKDAQGNEQPLTDITVRATEYVTPESMPAQLPPTSAYTYCAELTVDGAKSVRFEKPVTVLVNNFLGFNVGEVVPVGYYDRDRAVWVPAKNGVVVQLLDTNGDGIVDTYTDGQNQYLAPGLTDLNRYKPGSTYWRVELTHFSPWDCNWPYGPPTDAMAPNPPGPPITATKGKECELTHLSSYVENQECTFHEDLPIPGTDMFLHYASDRTPGFKPRITIPASGSSVPTSLVGIIVRLELAGRVFEVTLPPQANQQAEFIWDGRDYLGREVAGSSPARVRIGFEYPMVYYSGSSIFAQAFAQPGTTATWVRARENVIAWKESALTIHRGVADLAEGWTLSAHHLLNPTDPNTLQKGDGTRLTNPIRTLATVAAAKPVGDGLSLLKGVVVDNAGNIYFSDGYNYRYMKAGPGGVITYYSTLNTTIGMVRPAGLALDGAGNLYFTNPDAYHGGFVGKIDPEGRFSIIAGNQQPGFSGDGGPATAARLNYPEDLAVDVYGNIYITDTWNNRIRKVDPNGIITTIAGNGGWGFSGDGEPATQAMLKHPSGLALDSQGNVFFTDTNNNRVRKVDPSGVITTIAGNGQAEFSGDGGPATQAGLAYPEGLAMDRTGNLYIADAYNNRIRMVNTSGIISTLAGNGQRDNNNGEGGPATQATVHDPTGVAVDSSGNVYVAINGYGRIKKVSLPGAFKSLAFTDDTVFADENGQGYIIGSSGLHKSTLDLATGKTLLTFGYDQAHKLISITDRFSNRTTIQRGVSGVPLSITSPGGLVTRLTVDGNNQLTTVTYPDNGAYTFTYSPDGLLTDKVDPMGNRFRQLYDATGLITHVFDPEGGSWGFSRTLDNAGNASITLQTAEGNITAYQDRTDFAGAYTSLKTDPSGFVSTFTRSADGLTETEQSSCGLSRTMQYDLDLAYRYQYLREFTQRSPAGLTQSATVTKTYEDTNKDAIPDRITSILGINGRNWTTVNNTLTGTLTSTSSVGRTITRNYNPLSLLSQNITVQGLLPVSYGYDTRGRLTTATTGSRTSAITYDNQGNIASIRTPDGKTLGYTYDAVGRLKSQTLPDNSMIAYDYDLNGNMTVLTNPRGISHGFDYTGVNLRRTLATPVPGKYQYDYDKERNLKSILFPSGRQIVNTYAGSLLRTMTTPEGVINYSYTCSSLLGEATRGAEKVTYTYDGSLLTSDTRSGLLEQAIRYSYNNDFRLSSLTYGGDTQAFTYDNDGLLTGAGGFTISRNTRNGLPERVSDGTLATSRTFSGYGELDALVYTIGGTNKYSYGLTRDLAGRITQKVEIIDGATDTYTYSYDANGRLIEVKKNNTVVETYGYDANGNRLTEINTLRAVNRSYTVSAEDHLITAGNDSYQFGTDGFITSKTSGSNMSTYQYSSRGELLSATLPGGTTIAYDHDPMGRKIAKRVDEILTEKYFWKDAVTLLAVYDGKDNIVMRFNYGDDRMPVSMTHNGGNYYLLYDPIGSLRAVTGTSGNIIKRIDYDSFGNIVVDSNSSFSVPFGFAGGFHERATGLVRFGARDYDPAIGRWTAKDPIDFAGGDTNLYGYVMNDPVNWVDPEGLDTTNMINITGGRSYWDGPTNGNWGGKCWSGGQYSCGPGRGMGNSPPIDSGDECYQRHDRCYNACNTNNPQCINPCDQQLVNELRNLSNNPRLWPKPPRPGTEGDSRRYRNWAIWYFR